MPRITAKRKFVFLTLSCLCLLFASHSILGQNKDRGCFEFKHLDFFGLDGREINWPKSVIDQLLESEDNTPAYRTSFLVPMIVKQLSVFHSCTKKDIDVNRFKKLVNLYLKFRHGKPQSITPSLPIDEVLALIRKDFDDQINDDELLQQMIYSMDDGPLAGEISRSFPTNGKPFVIRTQFGTLKLSQVNERLYAGAFDKNEKSLWSRILKGTVPEHYLKNFDTHKIELKEFEAAGILSLSADGERLKIYFRPDGRFMFYTYSW